MFTSLACSILICGGQGLGAYDTGWACPAGTSALLRLVGVQPIIYKNCYSPVTQHDHSHKNILDNTQSSVFFNSFTEDGFEFLVYGEVESTGHCLLLFLII